ncbi:hypothetical protein UPYG_G00202910 [Umbra pygmaea]|uniref:Uncharacterized protein n=1 Tax=Umbra pygmaea TaxID=75934 RepID=A0ABD0X6H7_UMBPY
MPTDRISFKGFCKTLNRLEQRVEDISGGIGELDEAARFLTERLDVHRQAQAKQKQQATVQTSPVNSLSTADVSLLFGYVSDTLHICHTLVLQRVPDICP